MQDLAEGEVILQQSKWHGSGGPLLAREGTP